MGSEGLGVTRVLLMEESAITSISVRVLVKVEPPWSWRIYWYGTVLPDGSRMSMNETIAVVKLFLLSSLLGIFSGMPGGYSSGVFCGCDGRYQRVIPHHSVSVRETSCRGGGRD